MTRIMPVRKEWSHLRSCLRYVLALRHVMPVFACVVTMVAAMSANAAAAARPDRSDAIHVAKVSRGMPKAVPPANAKHAATSPDIVADQRIELHRNAGTGAAVLASVGIPFPPGVLRDTHLLRILDEHGAEVAAALIPRRPAPPL